MRCAVCKYNDGVMYTSIPPKYKCTITKEFYDEAHECELSFEPVKKGKWVWDPNGMDHGLGAWRCSACGGRAVAWWDADPKSPYSRSGSQYCSICGAKMEAGNE